MSTNSGLALTNRYSWLLVALCVVSAATPTGQRRVVTSPTVVLTHATVVDIRSGQLHRNRAVVIEGDRIAAIGRAGSVAMPKGARIVDVSGRYLLPGFWDAHVHLSYLGACALPVFVANGVTSVRDAGSRMEEIATWRRWIVDGEVLGPHIRSAGPNLESAEWLERAWKLLPSNDPLWQLGPRRAVGSPEEAADIVDALVSLGVDFIKFRNLSPASFRTVVAEAKRRGLPVAGHAPRGVSLTEASEAGIKSIEHAETAMLRLESLSDDERLRSFQMLATNGTLLTPTLVTDVAAHLTPDSVALAIIADTDGSRDIRRKYVTAKTVELWRVGIELKKKYDDPADWRPLFRREVADMRLARRAGVRLMAGTDIGSLPGIYPGSSLHDELELLIKEVGLTPLEALQSASLTPPIFFGKQDEVGTIERGKVADLVILDANPLADIRNARRIWSVIVAGKVLQRGALDAALAGVETAIRERSGCAAGEPLK